MDKKDRVDIFDMVYNIALAIEFVVSLVVDMVTAIIEDIFT